jgi:hypothetical protein
MIGGAGRHGDALFAISMPLTDKHTLINAII